jgi:hypothetical protein
MSAIAISIPSTAPAQAGFADGVMFAILADVTVGDVRDARNPLDTKRFCHRPYNPAMGSEGAWVM